MEHERPAEVPALPLDRYLAQSCFHRINVAYPGVRLVNEDPFIFVVPNFASVSECRSLVQLMRSSGAAQSSATAPGQQERRTSTTVFPAADEIRWLRQRIVAVTGVANEQQLEPTKLTAYERGEFFREHTDASFLNEKMWAFSARLADVDDDGVQDPCHWPSRFCTLFLYCDDVPAGGRTRFSWLDGSGSMPGGSIFGRRIVELAGDAPSTVSKLDFVPSAGTAVVHFPATTLESGCVPDPRTMHESETAVHPKHIVQQFIWPVPIDPGADVHADVRGEWEALLTSARGRWR